MNSPKEVKSGFPERVSISCPTCGTRHDLQQITGLQSNGRKDIRCPAFICPLPASLPPPPPPMASPCRGTIKG